ncbi:MAG: cobalt-precorrin 5A hydrolase/precorrin-3B C17-methyltransferase [Paracoccaceae bacterium]|jgi:cobalt-precorrin 5A hydrolase/precorrin-3B C17-methyltransferase
MALNPVVICLNRAGQETAKKIAISLSARLHGRIGRVEFADEFFDDALVHVRTLFASRVPIIGVCASGILIRSVAPMLQNKLVEPPLISVSDDGLTVVPLLGGHRGANRLANQVAEFLGARAAITTSGEVSLGLSLDEPPAGWALSKESDVKLAMANLLSGGGVKITGEEAENASWLSALPIGDELEILCTTKKTSSENNPQVIFYPKKFSLGVGCSRNCPPVELSNLVHKLLDMHDVNPNAIHSINTLDLKADEVAVLNLSRELTIPVQLFNSDELELETSRLANPSEVVFAEVGCHGVSEAAALAQVGKGGRLFAPKIKSANATCALAVSSFPMEGLNGRKRGRLSLVGIGPGKADWRTPEASILVGEADELIGYGLYLDLLGPIAAGKKRTDFPLGQEEERCRYALERAGEGANVALICSGDAGIYAMGALVYELLDRESERSGVSSSAKKIEVVSAPGVSALQAAAARCGAPLGNDFCAISLSDLLTPREDIIKRLEAASVGDFVVALYNPVSKRRKTLFDLARQIFLKNRPPETPVLIASSLGRRDETLKFRNLSDISSSEIDMLTVVIIGSSQSKLFEMGGENKIYTPRGYARKIDGVILDG